MAVEITTIRDPLWSKPAFVLADQPFDITAALPEGVQPEDIQVRLVRGNSEYSLTLKQVDVGPETGLQRLQCRLADHCPEQLYDLLLEWNGGQDWMPHAVQVLRSFPADFCFSHMGDPHIRQAGARRNTLLTRAIEELNCIRPAFALLTGDLTSRYGGEKRILPQEVTSADLQLAQELLLELDVPLFITPGNHDLAFPWMREDYARYVAPPFSGGRRNYAFRYGAVQFITYEAFVHYCPDQHTVEERAITPEQLQWLETTLHDAADCSARVLFFHYDYTGQLLPVFNEYRVNLAIYGHTKPLQDILVGDTPTISILDSSVTGRGHFRIVHVREGRIAERPYYQVQSHCAGS